jgi:hypothetical protein
MSFHQNLDKSTNLKHKQVNVNKLSYF